MIEKAKDKNRTQGGIVGRRLASSSLEITKCDWPMSTRLKGLSLEAHDRVFYADQSLNEFPTTVWIFLSAFKKPSPVLLGSSNPQQKGERVWSIASVNDPLGVSRRAESSWHVSTASRSGRTTGGMYVCRAMVDGAASKKKQRQDFGRGKERSRRLTFYRLLIYAASSQWLSLPIAIACLWRQSSYLPYFAREHFERISSAQMELLVRPLASDFIPKLLRGKVHRSSLLCSQPLRNLSSLDINSGHAFTFYNVDILCPRSLFW